MKTEKKIIIFSILLGLFAAVIDSIIDYLAFYEKPFWDLMIFDVSAFEVYIRSILLATFTIYGIVISKIIAKRKRTEEALQERGDQLIEAQRVAKLGHYVFDIKADYWTSVDQQIICF